MLSNQLYDLSKWIVLIFLPALAVFIQGMGELYLWDSASRWVGVINLLTIFLGSLLQISSYHYHNDNSPKGWGLAI
ncbi:phage holin [Facklamia miroungae]|uniref:Putative phage holin Dp-1 n=1 Tax=Facklamia miroungae TaxID=120956 RepID=A0A1G7PFV4_9LACT|nr:phage holin [Facklamia miroungae]NKZ28698.1 holin [Facklamia miroungae]SDF85123.1 Putative phage holin Dp-1 [Facklamia miroungae]